jgi:hypothetical protein
MCKQPNPRRVLESSRPAAKHFAALQLLCPDHVVRKRPVHLLPAVLDLGREGFAEALRHRIDESPPHGGEVLRLDAVAHVLLAELEEDLRQQLDVGTQHAEGLVDHLDEVDRVLDEASALDEGFDRFVALEAENDLRLRFQFEQSESETRERRKLQDDTIIIE